jgi:hypothetical protein
VATLVAVACALPVLAAARPSERFLVKKPFPIEAQASFPGGLFHWIDSLAGTSVGKTVPAHRRQYVQLFGPLTAEDKTQLAAFIAARGDPNARGSALLGVFCTAATVEGALTSVQGELTQASWNALAAALAHFRPKYEVVWNGGEIPNAFLRRARRDASLDRLEQLLAKIVHFYGVDPRQAPPPRLALVPVPTGHGTHAEAIGDVLLLEIRTGDTLADEASVIVHETSHFLWSLVPVERQQRMARYADGLGESAGREFALLREAIPTALGQGVADRAFRPAEWTTEGPWYHIVEVDTYARQIYPMVADALEAGLSYNEAFLLLLFRPSGPGVAGKHGGRPFLVSAGRGPYIASRTRPAGASGTPGR